MADLLLELFSEEIPARMQSFAAEELAARLGKALEEARLEHASIQTFVTPRRLSVRVEGLPALQPDRDSERKGPRANAPAAAIEGFCKSVGLKQEQLELRGDTYFAVIHEKGRSTGEALVPMIDGILKSFPWPKSQRWGAFDLHWVRPLRSIICLLDAEIIPVSFGHITAGRTTFGHRFLAPDAITIHSPAEYEAALEKAYVIADATRRKALIREQAMAAAKAKGVELRLDEGLLEEVTGLVEWPVCLMGQFDEKYLSLPAEVLILEMKHHQKYFACYEANGHERSAGSERMPPKTDQISRHFLLISNMTTKDGGAAIVNGNQRVLRARLDDGRFYWEHDRDTPLANWKPALEKMVFHTKLGSVAEKVARICLLAPQLAANIPGTDAVRVKRAGELCKSDLVSGMVGQFPELQGVMGRYYALAQKEDAAVADAIRDHYKPAGAEDDVPMDPVSVAVALADKLDSLVGLFAIGEKPTGSKDPFALRRAALGVIRIIFENKLRLPLRAALGQAMAQFPAGLCKARELEEELLAFFSDRLKVLLKTDGVRHDLIEAVSGGGREDDLLRLVARVKALESFLATEDGANLLAAYTRASNIVRKEEKKDSVNYGGKVDKSLLTEAAENALYSALETMEGKVQAALEQEDFTGAMACVAALRAPVDSFFEQVIVNAEDASIRKNRLHLLAHIRRSLDALANFGKIESKG